VQLLVRPRQAAVPDLARQPPASVLARPREVRVSARERQRQVRAASSFRAPVESAHPARRDARGS